jgi:CDP-diglyceride synthetase
MSTILFLAIFHTLNNEGRLKRIFLLFLLCVPVFCDINAPILGRMIGILCAMQGGVTAENKIEFLAAKKQFVHH